MPERRGRTFEFVCRILVAGVTGFIACGTSAAPGDELAELRARVEILERLVAQLQDQKLSRDDASAPMPGAARVAAYRNEGFTIPDAEKTDTLQVRGLLHFDRRYFADDATSDAADAWVLRRARPILHARLGQSLEVGFTPEFGGGRTTILDAFVTLRTAHWLRLTAGKFKVPVGLERIVSAADLRFIERGLPTALVPNRDLGIQLHGDAAAGTVSYSIGYFNGVTDGGSSESNVPTADAENDASGDWAARWFMEPFLNREDSALRRVGFGLAATYVTSTGTATSPLLPVFRTPGQQVFFEYRDGTAADGRRMRLAPQLYYYYGPFGLLGEAVRVSQRVSRAVTTGTVQSRDLVNNAWQLQFAWLITGEEQKFRGAIEPKSPFVLGAGDWGALELVARYHELDLDDDAFAGGSDSLADPAAAASRASAFGVGFNWYLNEHYKWSLNYDRTRFDNGAPDGQDRDDEAFFSGRFAVSF